MSSYGKTYYFKIMKGYKTVVGFIQNCTLTEFSKIFFYIIKFLSHIVEINTELRGFDREILRELRATRDGG